MGRGRAADSGKSPRSEFATKRHLAELALNLIRQAGLPEPATEVAMLISVTGDDLTERPLAFIRDLTQSIERRTPR